MRVDVILPSFFVFKTIGLYFVLNYDIVALKLNKMKGGMYMADVTARKRPNSTTWEYRIELAQVDGKRKQKSKGGFRTKADALKAGREALKAYENGGSIIDRANISVSDLFDIWLAEYSKTSLKRVTSEGYEKKIRLYIKPVIGQYKIKSITRQILQKLITDMGDKGFSKNTLSSVRGILTTCFDWAELNHYIVNTPAYKLKIPVNTEIPSTTKKHIYITQDQINMIFERFPEGHPSYLPMKIAYYTGLRLSEVYALTWQDIDLDKKLLSVNRQIQWDTDLERTKEQKDAANGTKNCGNGFWYFNAPKYFSYRTITIPNALIGILKKEKQKQIKAESYYEESYFRYYAEQDFYKMNHSDGQYSIPIREEKTDYEIDFVMRRENGSYITSRTMQNTSRVIHYKLETPIPDFDFHSFRHTHATMLLERHATPVYIQSRLGHADLDTTIKIYTDHLTEELKSQGDSLLGDL